MYGEGMTTLNFRLTGELEKKVQRYIKAGYATSKVEVIRAALSRLEEPVQYEDISDDPELEQYLLGVKSGRIKEKFSGPNPDLRKLTSKKR
jgi:Arc/MetJ-type ribon-helix-helix transcriptional regulator